MAKPFAEAVELAQHVLGQDGADLDGLDVALDERWGVSFATSEEIANELLALTMPFRSPLGGLLQALVRPDGAAMVALMRGPSCAVLATSNNGTAIIPPGPPRLGPDPKWDRRNALKVICRLVLEETHQAH